MIGRRSIEVPCTIEIERTGESFHAHAIPQGVALRPGDSVLVHGAPDRVAFGTRLSLPTSATVTFATWPERIWAQLTGLFELTDLYEVGFEAKETR